MSAYRPRLMEARSAAGRMDALCEFIEYWLRPARPALGELASVPDDLRVPMPLRRLYEFAGRYDRSNGGFLGFYPNQDWLNGPDGLTHDESGKVVFLEESQQVWQCRTLPSGEDPPVWSYSQKPDRFGVYSEAEELVSVSLSRLLITYVLQELVFGSLHRMTDDALSTKFFGMRNSVTPVWIDGPYAYGSDQSYSFHLWGHVLVADMGHRDYWLATNDEEGLRFLEENRGPVNSLRLGFGGSWKLEISASGGAHLEYRRMGQALRSVQVPDGTFAFPELVERFSAIATKDRQADRSASVSFGRAGHISQVEYLADVAMVEAMFRRALEVSRTVVDDLDRRLTSELS
ncbi:hypothetical protein [Aquisphaera insulae]|uniref:hypothetical protein n=1 Tax=Aquisphaera insulae TaxID=2712864 RepID=UPI0013EE3258|nr:hypothetical protein [Aquisphaera insulae]